MAYDELAASFRQVCRAGMALALAALCAGCFQPLYGEGTTTVVGGNLRDALKSIDVKQIDAVPNSAEAKLAVQIRNELLFSFTGGGYSTPPTHELIVKISGANTAVTIDRDTKLPTTEVYSLRTTYTLVDIATKKVVVTGRAVAGVSYDDVNQQRFARLIAANDAERRAARVISENITQRLSSYFISGG